MRTPRRYLEPLEHEMTDQQLDDVEIPDDEGPPDVGPRYPLDAADAADADNGEVDLSAGDALEFELDDEEDRP